MAINMAPDSGGGSEQGGEGLLTTNTFSVDVDELYQVANKVLGLADRVEAVGSRRTMHEASAYGMPLAEAGHRWADRYAHLLAVVAAEIEHSGYELRGTAGVYHEVELSADARLKDDASAVQWPW